MLQMWIFCEFFKLPPTICLKNVLNSRGIFSRMEGGVTIHKKIPVMDYRQYRRMRKLVHECCNYDNGNCIALDNGEECVCVQSISYSLLCKWFRSAVLPLDKSLETVLLFRDELKCCSVCGQPFRPGSNRAKYCKSCATKVHRRQKTDSDRKRRLACGQLESKKHWIYCCFKLLSMGVRDKSPAPLINLLLTVRRRIFT